MLSGLEWFCSATGTLIGAVLGIIFTIQLDEDLMKWIGITMAFIFGFGGYKLAGFISSRTDIFDSGKQWQKKYDQLVSEYTATLKKVNKEHINQLLNSCVSLWRSLYSPEELMSDKLTAILAALMKIKEDCTYGNLTSSQAAKIDTLVYNFCENMKYAPGVINNSKAEAAETGLGFGVIGSASAVALHATLDTLERQKNLRNASSNAIAYIDEKVSSLISAIQNI